MKLVKSRKFMIALIFTIFMTGFFWITANSDPASAITVDNPTVNDSTATLEKLAVSGGNYVQFIYNASNPQYSSVWPFEIGDGQYSIDLIDNKYDYICKDLADCGMGQMNVIAEPKNSEAKVNVYVTSLRNNTLGGGYISDPLTGKAGLGPFKVQFNNAGEYSFYRFGAYSDYYDTCTFRVEVIEGDSVQNYNIICVGAYAEYEPLEEIKAGFNSTVDEYTDVSSFTSSAKSLVETAKPIYKARMEAATDAMEACKIANEFNIIVCQAKAIEDEYTVLNDKVTDAEDALAESEAKNQELEDAKTKAEEALKQANEEIASKDGVISAARNYISELEESTEKITEDLNKANSDLSDALDKLDSTEKELEKAKTDNKIQKIAKVKAVSAKAAKKKVTVKWKKVTGATGYVVYRSLKKSKEYTEVKTIKKAGTVKFTDKKVKKGKKYFYKIRAYKTVSGNQMFGAYSKVLKTKKVK